jgi:hypothetical protein
MGRAFAKDPASARSPQRQPGRNRPSKELSPGALEAMAEAARWARSTAPDGMIGVAGAPTSPGRPPRPGSRPGDRHRRDRRLVISIGVVAVALVLVTAGLIGSLTSHRTPDPTSSATGASTPATAPAIAPTTTTPATTSPSTPSTPSTTTEPAAPTGAAAPVLSSLAPASGVPGQSVAVSGANLLSASGQIVARFGGQVAPTACPTPSTCTVTVPSPTGPPTSIPVTITTSSGTSNPLTFDYGSVTPTTAPRSCGRSHGGRSGCGAHGGPRSHAESGPNH